MPAPAPAVGFTFGGAPPPEVAAYFAEKSLRPAFRWTEVWGEEHAHAFTVAKAEQLEVLATIKSSLQAAIDKGTPYAAWAKALEPELRRQGWWGKQVATDPATGSAVDVQLGSKRRLHTIYDANLRTARAAGQWERGQRTKAVLPYYVYELGPSEHHRPEHVDREGMIYPVDDPVWNSWFPPNGWGCKCWVRQITRTEADRRGGESEALDIPDVPFERRRDDGSVETVRVPKGIDPGWATNPGKARGVILERNLAEKAAAVPPAIGAAVLPRDLWEAAGLDRLPEQLRPKPPLEPAVESFLGSTKQQRAALKEVFSRDISAELKHFRALAKKNGWEATPEELAVVRWYTTNAAYQFNERLRRGQSSVTDRQLRALIDGAVTKLPKAEGPVWRAPAKERDEAADIWASAKVGETLVLHREAEDETSRTPLSFATERAAAERHGRDTDLLFKTRGPTHGGRIREVSGLPQEEEFLVPSGVRFRVADKLTSEQDERGMRILVLEMLDP